MLQLSENVEVEITRSVYLKDGKLAKPGTVVTLTRSFAVELISAGKAKISDPSQQKQIKLPEKGKEHAK